MADFLVVDRDVRRNTPIHVPAFLLVACLVAKLLALKYSLFVIKKLTRKETEVKKIPDEDLPQGNFADYEYGAGCRMQWKWAQKALWS